MGEPGISIRTLGEVSRIDPSTARLPQTYEAAKKALAECERIDECKTWADKMAALASYARQADDDELHKIARRIQGRAVQRCGELLKEFDARGGDRKSAEIKNGGAPTFDPPISRNEVGERAGMSKDQQVTAVRVANIPADEFEAAIESDDPPTVTELAKAGTKARNALGFDYLQGRDPQKFNAAIHTLGALERFAEKCAQHTPEFVAGGVGADEVAAARKLVVNVDAWLNTFFARLEDEGP